MKNKSLSLALAFVFFVIDIAIKNWIYYNAEILQRFFVLGPIDISYHTNPGIAFGLNLPLIVVVPLSIALVGFVLWVFGREMLKSSYLLFLISLILFGAISNLIDRIRFGFVIDYINLHIWPVFNIADMMIVVGCVGIIYFEVLKSFKRKV